MVIKKEKAKKKVRISALIEKNTDRKVNEETHTILKLALSHKLLQSVQQCKVAKEI